MKKVLAVLVVLVALVLSFVAGAHVSLCPFLKGVCPFSKVDKPVVCDKDGCCVVKCTCGDQCCCCDGCCKK